MLNHLTNPAAGLAELARVTRPGGALLAAVFSSDSDSRSQARDRIDAAALAAGWQVPPWYIDLKTSATPLLGSRAAMAATACTAGLARVHAGEWPVDVGVTLPHQLVSYRLGHPIFASWLDALGPSRASRPARFRRPGKMSSRFAVMKTEGAQGVSRLGVSAPWPDCLDSCTEMAGAVIGCPSW